VVYGAGALSHAHTKDEQITASNIAVAAEVLLGTVRAFCDAGASR
jgi:acetylornithine deacetylase/succinyl-diaminopimelate desuccinylase-like protein